MAVKVYKGNSSYSGDVICNVSNGKVYKGRSSYSGDIICNISNGKIYKGSPSYSGDTKFNIDSPISIEEFVAVWFAVNYIY